MTPRSIVVVLLVDTVNSTMMLSELGQDRMDEVVDAEMIALRAAISEHEGTVVRSLGDGLLATFTAASTALDAAAAIHRNIARLNDANVFGVDVRVRVTLAASDATVGADEIRGVAPVLTSRLEDFAGAGETLCTDAVRALAEGWGAHRFERLEPLALRGIPEPVVVHRVEVPIADLLGIPESLEAGRRFGFVGREHEWQVLDRAWDDALAGAGSIVVLAGDPGIGKSRLCQEFARHVRTSGAIVLHGTCTELTGWAFEPFVRGLRQCLARVADVRHLLGAWPGDLIRIVPEIEARLPELEPGGSGADAETARYRLFEAVTSWLVDLTRHAPVLFVLDDVSWADDASIALLRYLVARVGDQRVLLLMTYRPGDASAQARRLLHDERAAMRRIDLAGLQVEQALVLSEEALGGTLGRSGREVITTAARRVGGNPLYLGEVVTHLIESEGLISAPAGWTVGPGLDPQVVPPTVADVILRRVDRLGQSAQRLLRLASIMGTSIDPPLLFELLDANIAESVQALEDATDAGFLHHTVADDRFEFTHAVFRDVIFNTQTRLRRAAEHQRIGEAIERRYAADLDPWLDVLAYQFEQSTELADADRAVDYLRRAGRQAEGQRGNDHAVGYYRRALRLVDDDRTAGRLRCELMIELGDAERRSGQRAARRTLLEATHCAIAIDDARLATQAVLGSGRGIFSLAGSVDVERVAVLREVLALLGPERTAHQARVLAALSAELIFDDDPAAAHDASDEALSIAREVGDPATLVTTMGLRLVALWQPDRVQDRLRLGAELDGYRQLAGSQRSGQFLSTMTLYCQAAMEGGEMELADQLLGWIERTADELRQPTTVGYAKLRLASRATVAGRLDEAEQLATEAYRLCLDAGQQDAQAFYTGQLFAIRWHQGRLGEVIDLLADAAAKFPGIPAFRAATATCAAEIDDLVRCRHELDVVAPELERIRFDLNWLPAMALTTVAAARLGDAGIAARLRPMLEPYRHQFVDNASTFFGSVQRFYALCSAVVEDHEAADSAFESALEAHRRLGSSPLLARTQLEYAETLARRGPPLDARVVELATAAQVEAERRGYRKIMTGGARLLAQVGSPTR